MSKTFIAVALLSAVCLAVVGATMITPHQLGLAYGCGMVAETNRLLKLQDLKPSAENERCAEYRKLWEGMSR